MNYTTILQSRTLSHILPKDSADKYYYHQRVVEYKGQYCLLHDYEENNMTIHDWVDTFFSRDLPCWSCGALQNLLPKRISAIKDGKKHLFGFNLRWNDVENKWELSYETVLGTTLITILDTTVIDCLYYMILYIKDNNFYKFQ